MCTPTDRALAIEELEHLEIKVKDWIEQLKQLYFYPNMYRENLLNVMNEMSKEISK